MITEDKINTIPEAMRRTWVERQIAALERMRQGTGRDRDLAVLRAWLEGSNAENNQPTEEN